MFQRMRALLAQLAGSRPTVVVDPAMQDDRGHDRGSVAEVRSVGQPQSVGGSSVAPPDQQSGEREIDHVVAVAPIPGATPATQETLDQARRLVTSGATNQAIALVRTELREHPDPDVATALHELETIQRARKRLRRRPNDVMAHFELGRALFAQEQGAEALEHLDIACRLRPGWLEANLLRAYELHWQSRWQEAEAAYQTVLHLDPTHATARRGLIAVRICQPPDATSGGMAAG